MYDHQKLILKNKLLLRKKVIKSSFFLTLHLAFVGKCSKETI